MTVVALESPEEIPADPEEIAEAEAEGIKILYRTGPHRFVGDGGRVTGLETIDVRSVFDDDGRFNPTFVARHRGAVLPADTVILAVGQAADLDVLGGRRARAHRAAAASHVDPITLRTSHPRIWAGGDVAHGPRNLIDAIADGQRAAAVDPRRARRRAPRRRHDVRVELRRRPAFAGVDSGYDAIAAPAGPGDADRPARSASPRSRSATTTHDAWLEVAPLPALLRQRHARPELCILCGLCVDVCPPNCITIARADHVGLGERVAERAAARRGPLHPLRAVRQPLPARARCRWFTRGSSRD